MAYETIVQTQEPGLSDELIAEINGLVEDVEAFSAAYPEHEHGRGVINAELSVVEGAAKVLDPEVEPGDVLHITGDNPLARRVLTTSMLEPDQKDQVKEILDVAASILADEKAKYPKKESTQERAEIDAEEAELKRKADEAWDNVDLETKTELQAVALSSLPLKQKLAIQGGIASDVTVKDYRDTLNGQIEKLTGIPVNKLCLTPEETLKLWNEVRGETIPERIAEKLNKLDVDPNTAARIGLAVVMTASLMVAPKTGINSELGSTVKRTSHPSGQTMPVNQSGSTANPTTPSASTSSPIPGQVLGTSSSVATSGSQNTAAAPAHSTTEAAPSTGTPASSQAAPAAEAAPAPAASNPAAPTSKEAAPAATTPTTAAPAPAPAPAQTQAPEAHAVAAAPAPAPAPETAPGLTPAHIDALGTPVPAENIPKGYDRWDISSDVTGISGFTGADYNLMVEGTGLAGVGPAIAEAEQQTGINGLFILSHMAIESAWGTSYFARTRNNYWGLGAYTEDPDHAFYFSSVEACLDYYINLLKTEYLNPGDTYYGGGVTVHDIFVHYSTSDTKAAEAAGQAEDEGIVNTINTFLAKAQTAGIVPAGAAPAPAPAPAPTTTTTDPTKPSRPTGRPSKPTGVPAGTTSTTAPAAETPTTTPDSDSTTPTTTPESSSSTQTPANVAQSLVPSLGALTIRPFPETINNPETGK